MALKSCFSFRKALRQQQKILNELREMFHASDIFDKDHYTKILMVRFYLSILLFQGKVM